MTTTTMTITTTIIIETEKTTKKTTAAAAARTITAIETGLTCDLGMSAEASSLSASKRPETGDSLEPFGQESFPAVPGPFPLPSPPKTIWKRVQPSWMAWRVPDTFA